MNLPTTLGNLTTVLDNLRAARQEVGSGAGSGETLVKINDHTGEVTFGAERNPWPEGMRWAVALESFRYGYIDWQDGKPVERNVIRMMEGAKPLPKGGSTTKDIDPATGRVLATRSLGPGEYGSYGGGGPQDVCEIVLTSLDEPGFHVTLPASKSSANRVGNLLENAIVHCESAQGRAGFVHPVINFKVSKYYNTKYKRDVYHFDYDLVDWLHTDGERLLSKHGGVISQRPAESGVDGAEQYQRARATEAVGAAEEDGPAPWDDDEEMTEEERELLKA